ncbi:MAG: DMT family transporter [Armatimonadetes bacterium]|nr:DMT family transporter [Armatimonadota bacterium]
MGIWSWALPLACTVLFYGLAAGVWKEATLTVAQFCILFALTKTVTNWGAWAIWGRRNPFDPGARAFMGWALLGQLVNGIAWIGYFRALESGPAAIVQTVTAAYTALATVLAVLFLKERLVAIQMAGVSMVVAAGMILGYESGGGAVTASGNAWWGDCMITLVCWGVAVVIFKHAYGKPGADDYRFFLTNWLAMAVTVLPFGCVTLGEASWSEGLAKGMVIVLLYCIGDLTLFAAINRGPASIVSPLSGLYPIPTIAYVTLVLHVAITNLQWLAIALVLVAIILVVPASDNPVLRLWNKTPEEKETCKC